MNVNELTAPANRKDYSTREVVEEILKELDNCYKADIIAALLEAGVPQERAFELVNNKVN